MLFNSFAFLIFFVVVTTAYYLFPPKTRWFLLLLSSCFFYAFLIPSYLLILFAIILIDYFAGRLIEKNLGRTRKIYLLLSILANLTILFVFKYHDFFVDNMNRLAGPESAYLTRFSFWRWALPIGLSFHTFQAMSYTIEVYRGKQKAEKHLGIYALYVLFYPQLVAGPIERPQHLLPQLNGLRKINFEGIQVGLKWMLWGFFMKVVVADRLGIYVDYVYRNPENHGRLALVTACLFYSFQIYCDFAGYSLIALGSAKALGFQLTANFRRPYLAAGLREFWSRWNITLSSWFRDYVYFPLGGSRVATVKYVFNILVVFILSGLWHGANWTFLAWGLLHAMYIFTGHIRRKILPGLFLPKAIGIIFTFIAVTLSWIFFRSAGVLQAWTIIKRIFSPSTVQSIGGEFDERALLVYSVAGIATVLFADWMQEYNHGRKYLYSNKLSVRLAYCIGLVIVIVLFGVFDGSQFIYFQF